MNERLKEKMKNRNMKNGLRVGLVGLILAVMVLLSGCVGQDGATSPTSPKPGATVAATISPTVASTTAVPATTLKAAVTPKATSSSGSGSKVPAESLVFQDDVPELMFGSFEYITTHLADSKYVYSTRNSIRGVKTKDQVADPYRIVGQVSTWSNRDQQSLSVEVNIFDSNVGNGKAIPDQLSYCATPACGSANIGDISQYHTDPSGSGMELTTITYVKGEYYVFLSYQDKTGQSFGQAIKVAKAIEGRIKPKFAALSFPKVDIGSGIPSASIIKQADVPELKFGSFSYMIVMATQEFIYSTKDKASPSNTIDDNGGTYKVVGHASQWFDKDVQSTNIQVVEFEKDEGNDLPKLLAGCKHVFCGSVNVGSASYYFTDPWDNPKNPTMGQTTLYFAKGKYFVTIKISGKNGANYKEAEKLAIIIADRLN